MKNGRPYNYNSKSRLTNQKGTSSKVFKTKKSVNKKKKEISKKIENTLINLKIEDIKPSESQTLDTSFLEGRTIKKTDNKTKKNFLSKITIILSFLAICFLCFLSVFIINNSVKMIKELFNVKRNEIVDKKVVSNVDEIDDNYLFVGDFHTEKFPFDDFGLDYHFVKCSSNNMTSNDVLNNMKECIYDYNPSIVFIELGYNDLDNSPSDEEFISNIRQIIKYIKNKRPYAVIYIESVYPVNGDSDVDSNRISYANEELKKVALEENVAYLDIYSLLIGVDNNLDKNYSDNGLFLNKDGYQQIMKSIKKVVG